MNFVQMEMNQLTHILRDCQVARIFWREAGLPLANDAFFGSNCLDWIHSNACNARAVTNKTYL